MFPVHISDEAAGKTGREKPEKKIHDNNNMVLRAHVILCWSALKKEYYTRRPIGSARERYITTDTDAWMEHGRDIPTPV